MRNVTLQDLSGDGIDRELNRGTRKRIREYSPALRLGRHVGELSAAGVKPLCFIVAKDERLVLYRRTAHRPAKLIVLERRSLPSDQLFKVIRRVELIAAEEL